MTIPAYKSLERIFSWLTDEDFKKLKEDIQHRHLRQELEEVFNEGRRFGVNEIKKEVLGKFAD